MILVGLTGGIGSGKSTVSALLAEHGAVIIDADVLVRELQAPGSPVLEQMAERFGQQIIRDDGSLDRAAVAEIVFNDEASLKALNDIVHPALAVEVTRRIDAARETDDVVVLDFPLLAERPRKGLERDRGRRRAGRHRGRAAGGVAGDGRGRRQGADREPGVA